MYLHVEEEKELSETVNRYESVKEERDTRRRERERERKVEMEGCEEGCDREDEGSAGLRSSSREDSRPEGLSIESAFE